MWSWRHQILHNSRRLQSLDLSGNRIASAGGKHIGEALKDNHSLELLNLEKNELGSSGIRTLSESLRDNVGLKTLFLQHNRIESKGGADLADALKANRGENFLRNLHENYMKVHSSRTKYAPSIAKWQFVSKCIFFSMFILQQSRKDRFCAAKCASSR